jgi:nucleotide-binding universal stress UspA family protein
MMRPEDAMASLQGPVLINSDLSPESDDALRAGVTLAGDLRTTWSVCHVVPEAFRVRVLFPQDAGIESDTQRELSGRAIEAVRLQVAAVVGRQPSPSEIQIETGTPHTGVVRAAGKKGAALIVMTPGATATRVARAAEVPVLVFRQSPADGAVLGATDFSDPSVPALSLAMSEASRRGVRLRFLHCLDIDASAYLAAAGAPGVMASVPFPESVIATLESDSRAQLQQAARASNADIVVLRQSPSTGILNEAVSAPTALVVVGTHGRSGLARLALGSVAEYIMQNAPCSVLVVPLNQSA